MKFFYTFPAVRGIQANNEYYISMVPLSLLKKLFPDIDNCDILPEYRAQRKVNEARIPEIKKYILDNKNSYVFSALSASIDGDFEFVPVTESSDAGTLKIDMNSSFLINDGQHRKAAIIEALNEDKSLENETISIVFFKDSGLARSQQMFTDLNKHAVKTSNSLSTLYDSRDEVAVATRMIIEKIPFLNKYTDKERDILGKNSYALFTLNTIYKANQTILKSNFCNEEDSKFLYDYWKLLSDNIVEWQEVYNGQLAKKSLRENYIISLAVVVAAFGNLGRYFYENQSQSDMRTLLANLKMIDWSRSNSDWRGRTITYEGKIDKSEHATLLTCNKIKQLIGVPLTKEEERKEKQFLERKI